ncbi:Protein FAM107B [Nymphon striatum]|nr:Protein FAM107B [Nymphon striatum]
MIPEPDYSDEEDGTRKKNTSSTNKNISALSSFESTVNQSSCMQHSIKKDESRFTEEGLVLPKKINNPCLECTERQNVHKELLFNQKIGKDVLNKKSELQKVMDKFTDDQKKKEKEQERISKRNSLEKRLEEQANKIKQVC